MKIPLLNEFEITFNDPVWLEIGAEICRRNLIRFKKLSRAEHGENIVIFVDEEFILKIYTPKKNGYNRERSALEFVRGKTLLPTSKIIACGVFDDFQYLVTDRLPGGQMRRDEWLKLFKPAQTAIVTQMAHGLKEIHVVNAADQRFSWKEFVEIQLRTVMERQRNEGGNPEWLQSLPGYLETYMPLLPDSPDSVFMHGDVHFGNLRFSEDTERPVITGLFDFADSLTGFFEYEFVAIGVLMIQGQGDLQREFFQAYGYAESEINIDLRRRMMLLTIIYEHSSLRRYAERLGPGAQSLTLDELERAIWNFL
jgi:aminoglycoside phosphotransferase (APT) family kinase protein